MTGKKYKLLWVSLAAFSGVDYMAKKLNEEFGIEFNKYDESVSLWPYADMDEETAMLLKLKYPQIAFRR